MATCTSCGKEDVTAEMEMTGRGLVCPGCHYDRAATRGGGFWGLLRRLHPLAAVGLLAGVAPFFYSFTITHSVERNGVTTNQVTEMPFSVYLTLGCGGLAAVMGLILVVLARRGGRWRKKQLWIALAVLALGLYQLGTTLGLIPELPIPGL
jgi:hypothetical protein